MHRFALIAILFFHSLGAAELTFSGPARSVSNNKRPTFSGTATAGAVVDLSISGLILFSPTADVSGLWSWTPSFDLFDRSYLITAQVGADTATKALRIDTIPPATPMIISPATGSVVSTGAFLISGHRSIDTVDGITPELSLYENEIFAFDPPGGAENWQVTSSGFTAGYHVLSATVSDLAGNISGAASVQIRVDPSSPPAPIFTAPTERALLAESRPIIAGSLDRTGLVMVSVDGIKLATVSATPAWYLVPPTSLAQGSRTLSAVLVTTGDVSLSPSAHRAVTIDSLAPTVAILPPTTSATRSSTVHLTGTCTDAGDLTPTVTLSWNGNSSTPALVSGGTWTASATVADGTYNFVASAGDDAGNNSTSAAVALVVDTQAPAAPIFTSPAPTVANTSVSIAGTGETGSIIDVLDNGLPLGSATVSAGAWTFDTTLTAGSHVLSATSRDSAGNISGSASSVFLIDNGSPMISIVPARTSARTGERFAVTFLSNEPVTGFTQSDITVTGGLLTTFSLSATAGELARGLVEAGTAATGYLVITIPAGAATDVAGTPTAQATAQVQVPNGGDDDDSGGGGCGAGGGNGVGLLLAGLLALAGLARRRRR